VKPETVIIRDRIFTRCPECKRLSKPIRCRYCGKQYKSPAGLFAHEDRCVSNPLGFCRIGQCLYRECSQESGYEFSPMKSSYPDGDPSSPCDYKDTDEPACKVLRENNWLLGGYKLAGPDDTYEHVDRIMDEIKSTMTPDAVKPPWMKEAGDTK
jgi:hypothetical protein